MAAEIQKPSIYFAQHLPHAEHPEETPAPQRIGSIWAQIRDTFRSNDRGSEGVRRSLLHKLGVTETDEKAHRDLIPIIQAACSEEIEIVPSPKEGESGVYFLSKEGKRFAVFKIGEKRAQMELVARQIAHKTGFEDQVIPGVFCSIANPRLWNDNQKVFTGKSKGFCTVTGILEPYLPPREPTPNGFAKRTVAAVILGLRDGKSSSAVGDTWVDIEELTRRHLPKGSPDRCVAALHLPALEDPLAKQLLDSALIRELSEKLEALNLDLLLKELANERIAFPDLASEKRRVSKQIQEDHGGCLVTVEKTQQIMEDQPTHVRLDPNNPESYQLLSGEQLHAFKARLERLRSCLRSAVSEDSPLTSMDIVRSVDPLYDAHMRALEKAGFDREPFSHVVGRYPPLVTRVKLSPATQGNLAAEAPLRKPAKCEPFPKDTSAPRVPLEFVPSLLTPRPPPPL
jgi:hypothetical protein